MAHKKERFKGITYMGMTAFLFGQLHVLITTIDQRMVHKYMC